MLRIRTWTEKSRLLFQDWDTKLYPSESVEMIWILFLQDKTPQNLHRRCCLTTILKKPSLLMMNVNQNQARWRWRTSGSCGKNQLNTAKCCSLSWKQFRMSWRQFSVNWSRYHCRFISKVFSFVFKQFCFQDCQAKSSLWSWDRWKNIYDEADGGHRTQAEGEKMNLRIF